MIGVFFQDRKPCKKGFWRELKKLSETSKIPIVFTADNVEANTGKQSFCVSHTV